MAASAPSLMMQCAAIAMACSPEAQKRLTVVAATVEGKPALNVATRAMLCPWEACGWPQPKMTSSISPRPSCGTFPMTSLMQ